MKLSRSTRMNRGGDFSRVRREGTSSGGRFLVVASLRDQLLPGFKSGIITSRRVGNAVARNRIRRRVRAIVQAVAEEIRAGHYVVTIARKGAADASFRQLNAEWLRLAHRQGLLPRRDQAETG